MKLKPVHVSVLLVGCLHFSICLAKPPGNTREEEIARGNEFLEKAHSGNLDCIKEISQGEIEIRKSGKSSKVYDVNSWRAFGSQQCFRALLKAKAFGAALSFVASANNEYLNKWRELALEDSVEIPFIVTDGKCKTGEQKYSGDEQAKLILALLKESDLRDHPPGRRAAMEGVLGRMSEYEEFPACMSKVAVVGWINKFIDLGLETKYWWEEPMVVGGLNTFSGIMRLGDEALVKRILSGGLNQNREYVAYLFARAPSLEMVKILEQYFKLKRTDYQAALKIIEKEKQFSDDLKKYGAGMASPEMIEYFKQRTK